MTHLRENYWAVEVPEGAKDIHCEVSMNGTPYVAYKFKDDELLNEYEDIVLPPGTWQIICTSKEATYTQAAQIVEHYRGGFVNYHTEIKAPAFQTPFQSLESLLASKDLTGKNYLIIQKM